MVRLTDSPDMTLDVYRGPKTTTQQQQLSGLCTPPWFSTIYSKDGNCRALDKREYLVITRDNFC